MQQRIMDDNGDFWLASEIREAGPYEFYVEPYPNFYNSKNPKIVYTGEHKTTKKVLIVTPVNTNRKTKFSNN